MGDNILPEWANEDGNIREALGNPIECDIVIRNNTYIIKPQDRQGEVQINAFYGTINVDGDPFSLLRTHNLVFDHCVFRCEVGLNGSADNSGEIIPIDNKIKFQSCTFQKAIYFSYTRFNRALIFHDSIFEHVVRFDKAVFNSKVGFLRCKFKNEAYFFNSIFSEIDMHNSAFEHICVKQSKFQKKADFSDCKFQNEADFSVSTFYEQVIFKESIFKASAYFNQASFMSNADFERSEFCENAHFYQAKFSRDLNFFQTMFNERLNLTDAKIHNEDPNIPDAPIFNFDFEQLEERVQTCSEADEFRDVFKNIKNALIKSGNLLGASRFRKMELYCKEIELGLKKEEVKKEIHDTFIKNNNTQHNNKTENDTKDHKQKQEDSEKSDIRNTIDRIQLMFYRLTSDHHTDLLLITINVLELMMLFSISVFVLFCRTHCLDYINKKVFCNSEQVYSLFIELLKIIRGAFIENPTCIEIVSIIFLCTMFVFLYIIISYCVHYYVYNYYPKICFIIFCIPTAIILAAKPALILPIFGKLIDESLKVDFPAFTSLSVVYAVLMFLLIWSLQKTARKNTIMPN